MKYIKFRESDIAEVKAVLESYPDPIPELDRLGFIQDVALDDDYESRIFARIYLAFRRRLRHQNQHLIKEGDSQWKLLKQVTDDATQFCELHDFELREGFVTYLEWADDMGALPLNKLRYKLEQIIEAYHTSQIMDQDPLWPVAEKILDAYTKEGVQRYGYAKGVEKTKDYLLLIRAANLSVQYKLSPMSYVEYLAEKWEWTGQFKLHHLSGDKTEEYLKDFEADNPKPIPKVKKVKLKKGLARW